MGNISVEMFVVFTLDEHFKARFWNTNRLSCPNFIYLSLTIPMRCMISMHNSYGFLTNLMEQPDCTKFVFLIEIIYGTN